MSPAMLTALQAQELRPAVFVAATFASGPMYMWSGRGPITWNGHTWTGVGAFGGVSIIEEGATVEAKGISLSLSGVDPASLADALQEIQLGLPVQVYLGLFDSSMALIADPLSSWVGRMDQPTIDISGTTATIAINCENRLLEMGVPVDRRYTQDDQQIQNPGDNGFKFVVSIQELTIFFGQSAQSQNNL